MVDISRIKYPIYIVSKGRYERPYTANLFKKYDIDFNIVVEPSEYQKYCKSIDEKFVKKLPFQNLGLGSFPARNWCWEDSIKNGFDRHFIFDDNIINFSRLNHGKRKKCDPNNAIISIIKFTNMFQNIGISGFNYRYFAPQDKRAFNINCHVYSAMLINNKMPHRWRLKYNEDIDLCLQVLHSGKLCTVLINAYLVDKISTVRKLPGGNQTELYNGNSFDKKRLKAKSLEMIWPQYVKTVYKYGRPHHNVSWHKYFKHPLLKSRIQPNGTTTKSN